MTSLVFGRRAMVADACRRVSPAAFLVLVCAILSADGARVYRHAGDSAMQTVGTGGDIKVKMWTWNSPKKELQQEADRIFDTDADLIVTCQTEAKKPIYQFANISSSSRWWHIAHGQHAGIAGGSKNFQYMDVFLRKPSENKYTIQSAAEDTWKLESSNMLRVRGPPMTCGTSVSKKYQYLATAVNQLWVHYEKRVVREGLKQLAAPVAAECAVHKAQPPQRRSNAAGRRGFSRDDDEDGHSFDGGGNNADGDGQIGSLAWSQQLVPQRGTHAGSSHKSHTGMTEQSRHRGGGGNSRGSNAGFNGGGFGESEVASAANIELGFEILEDIFASRLRHSLRCWDHFMRRHRMQDLESTVLQALRNVPATTGNSMASAGGSLSPAVVGQSGLFSPLSSAAHHTSGSLVPGESNHAYSVSQGHSSGHSQSQMFPAALTVSVLSSSDLPPAPSTEHSGADMLLQSEELRTAEQQVAEIEKQHGPYSRQALTAVLNLAEKYRGCGNAPQQAVALERAVRIQEHLHGECQPESLPTFESFAAAQGASSVHGEIGGVGTEVRPSSPNGATEEVAPVRTPSTPVASGLGTPRGAGGTEQLHAGVAHQPHPPARPGQTTESGPLEVASDARVAVLEKEVQDLQFQLQQQRRKASREADEEVVQMVLNAGSDGAVSSRQRFPSPDPERDMLRQLCTDQARVDEVIRLATVLWSSGVLVVNARRPPLVKASLLIRLAERCHRAMLRDSLQLWWRRAALRRSLEESAAASVPEASFQTSEQVSEQAALQAQLAEHEKRFWTLSKDCDELRSELRAAQAGAAEQAEAAAKAAAAAARQDCDELLSELRAAQAAAAVQAEAAAKAAADAAREAATREAAERDAAAREAAAREAAAREAAAREAAARESAAREVAAREAATREAAASAPLRSDGAASSISATGPAFRGPEAVPSEQPQAHPTYHLGSGGGAMSVELDDDDGEDSDQPAFIPSAARAKSSGGRRSADLIGGDNRRPSPTEAARPSADVVMQDAAAAAASRPSNDSAMPVTSSPVVLGGGGVGGNSLGIGLSTLTDSSFGLADLAEALAVSQDHDDHADEPSSNLSVLDKLDAKGSSQGSGDEDDFLDDLPGM